jgi:hypothetical protein
MPPEESIQTHEDVNGRAMLPVHWGTFDLGHHEWDAPIIRTIAAAEKALIPFSHAGWATSWSAACAGVKPILFLFIAARCLAVGVAEHFRNRQTCCQSSGFFSACFLFIDHGLIIPWQQLVDLCGGWSFACVQSQSEQVFDTSHRLAPGADTHTALDEMLLEPLHIDRPRSHWRPRQPGRKTLAGA